MYSRLNGAIISRRASILNSRSPCGACAETVVVHRLAQDGGCRPFGIEVGIAAGESRKDL